MHDPIFLAVSRYLMRAQIHSEQHQGDDMKNVQSNSKPTSTQHSQTSKLSRIGLTLTIAATLLCGVAGLSTYSAAQTQTNTSEATSVHQGWVQIPGQLIRPDCVHEIPKGARVEIQNGEITGDVTLNGARIAHYDACTEAAVVTRPRARTQNVAKTPGTGNGWVEADQWNVPLKSSDNIDYMGGTWYVPSYPKVGGGLIYLFNGVEPASGKWILQPVLQFGSNGQVGGNYWAIASWLVGSNGYAFHSPLETVNPGDWINGYTEMTGVSGSTKYFEVVAQDASSGTYSWITAHVSGQHWTWAYAGVLEAYNVSSCSQFPANGRDSFSNSVVAHGFPAYDEVEPDFYGAIYDYGGPSCHFLVLGASATLDF